MGGIALAEVEIRGNSAATNLQLSREGNLEKEGGFDIAAVLLEVKTEGH